VLAAGDTDVGGGPEFREPVDVAARPRFLEEGDVEVGELPRDAPCGVARPELVLGGGVVLVRVDE
jgi:hypothetical protein